MTGFRELPPLRVKLVGDNTSYKKMADESKAIAEDLAKAVNATAKKTKAGPAEAEFLRVFHNYRLLEKSKEIQASLSRKATKIEEARLFQNEQLLEKMRAVEEAKGRAAKRAAEKALRAEETRLFQNQVLLEKIRQLEMARGRAAQRAAEKALIADENRLFRNESLLEKIRQLENKRANAAKRAAEKALAAEEQRIFQNELLLEKIRQKELAIGRAAEKAAARAIKAEEDRIFQNEALLDKIRQKEVAKGRAAVRAAEKALAAEEARLFQNEVLLDKIRQLEVKRGNAAARAAEKAKKAEEDRLFSNLQLLEKINALEAKRKGAAARREEDRIFSNQALLEKSQAIQAKKADLAAKEQVKAAAAAEAKWVASMRDRHKEIEKVRTGFARMARDENAAMDRMAKAGGKKLAAANSALTALAMHADRLTTKATAKQLADARKLAETKRKMHEQEIAAARKIIASRFGGGSSGGTLAGLGDRADIYMHLNAIKGTLAAASSFVAASANWQRMQVQMEGFTGSKQGAATVMEQMRKSALESPYDMQTIMGSVKTMMAYGAAVEQAQEVTKMLGDVAGGSNEKLDRLSLGMAQIISLGKLQGNELRQLTEHGFNPLRTIAERTLKPMQTLEDRMRELNKMKEDGLITSQAVIAALRIETSEGGRFAGMSKRMSQDVWGLGQQIKELLTFVQKRFTDTLLKEIEDSLRIVIRYLKELDQWMQANPEAVKSYAQWAKTILTAVIAVNALGMVMAMARWQGRLLWSALTLIPRAIGGILELAGAIRTVAGASSLAGSRFAMLAGRAGAVGAVFAIFSTITYGLHPHIRAFNREMERSAALFKELRESQSGRFETLLGDIGSETDAVKRQTMLNDAIAAGTRELQGYNTQITNQKALVDKLSPSAWTLYQGGRKMWAAEVANLSQLESLRDDQKARLDRLNAMLAETPASFEFDSSLNNMLGGIKSAENKVRYMGPVQAVEAGSSQAAVRMHEYLFNRRAETARAPMNEMEVSKDMAKSLRKIEANTRSKPETKYDNANLVGAT